MTPELSPELPLNLTLDADSPDAFIRQFLRHFNTAFEPESYDGPVGYRWRDGQLVIASELWLLYREAESRYYEIGDLVDGSLRSIAPLYSDGSEVTPSMLEDIHKRAAVQDRLHAILEAPSFGTYPTPERKPLTYPDALIALVEECVGRQEMWDINGGPYRVGLLQSTLRVYADPATHAQITYLLDQLRQIRVDRLASQMRDVEVTILLSRVEEYRLAQRYSQAHKLVRTALRVDPKHPLALAAIQVLKSTQQHTD